MKRTVSCLLSALVAFVSLESLAQTFNLQDFESITTPITNSVMFRQPSFSGSTSSKLLAPPNETAVESVGIPLGNPNVGINALRVSFRFADTTNLWLRLTTFGAPTMPNPTVGLWPGWGMQFDINTDTPIYVAPLIRETEANAALGANGGSSGNIEFVGGNPSSATGNRGKSVAANTWTTLVYDYGTEPIFSFTGNGVLNGGVDNKGVLEALGIAADQGTTGTINIWVDNFKLIPEPSTVALAVLGGLGMALWRARRRAA